MFLVAEFFGGGGFSAAGLEEVGLNEPVLRKSASLKPEAGAAEEEKPRVEAKAATSETRASAPSFGGLAFFTATIFGEVAVVNCGSRRKGLRVLF